MHNNSKELQEAMNEAEKAFEESLEQKGLDPAYFDVEIKGWLLSTYEFEPLGRARIIQARHKNSSSDESDDGEKAF